MSDLTAFIAQGWQDHADDPRGVADRLPHALSLVADEAGLVSLVGLAHHVHGEHLGNWQEGIACIGQLAGNVAFVAGGDSGAACRRALASLRLSGGLADERTGLTPADLIRVSAMAAANLASRDTARAAGLLGQAHKETPGRPQVSLTLSGGGRRMSSAWGRSCTGAGGRFATPGHGAPRAGQQRQWHRRDTGRKASAQC